MIDRRKFINGSLIASAAMVVGFDKESRSWISSAQAADGSLFDGAPILDGQLVFDPSVLQEYSSDYGGYKQKAPIAVLRPANTADVAKMVAYCRDLGIVVSARGQGHTTNGQSLAQGGLIVQMSTLRTVGEISNSRVEVGAGVTWKELLAITIPKGFTPPVLTAFTALSVGGTLSVGGISGGLNRGSQGDHVGELEVVTGTGNIVRCSDTENQELFHACLAGLGQCAIITKAVVG